MKKLLLTLPFMALLLLAPQVTQAEQTPLWDVGEHMYKNAIWNLYNSGIVSGNDMDKSYQPDFPINRAAFAKIAIGATTFSVPKSETGCLKDIAPGLWYTDFICYANSTLINAEPIIKGHPDGYFRPEDNIRFSELSKIVALLYGLKSGEGQVWYEGYIQALSDANAIPPSIKTPEHFVTRGEMAEVMDRLIQDDQTRSSTKFNYSLQSSNNPTDPTSNPLALCLSQATPLNVDSTVLQNKALELTNQARQARTLPVVNPNDVLKASSMIWALNGQFTHTRPNGQNLADYETNIGLTSLSAFGENLGEASFDCQKEDCTQEALTALEDIHQLFMEEETLPQGERGHFENITGDFDSVGLGFSIQNGKILFVFQYGKGITGDAEMLCKNLQ